MSNPAEVFEEHAKPLTFADLDRLLGDLWDGYQELLEEERQATTCSSQDNA